MSDQPSRSPRERVLSDRDWAGPWWVVWVPEKTPGGTPVAAFRYSDHAVRWAAANYAGRHEIATERAPLGDQYPLAPQALAAFGERRQMLALAEELAEAAATVARLLNGKGDKTEVLTELVDVESVTASLRDVLGSPEAWDRVRLEKRAKLAKKLASGEIRTRPEVPTDVG